MVGGVRIAFTGGRDYANEKMVEFIITLICKVAIESPQFKVGCCPTGADRLVRKITAAAEFCDDAVVFNADWDLLGLSAGPVRNRQMLDSGVELLIAFPGHKGTADCIQQAVTRGIPVIRVP